MVGESDGDNHTQTRANSNPKTFLGCFFRVILLFLDIQGHSFELKITKNGDFVKISGSRFKKFNQNLKNGSGCEKNVSGDKEQIFTCKLNFGEPMGLKRGPNIAENDKNRVGVRV